MITSHDSPDLTMWADMAVRRSLGRLMGWLAWLVGHRRVEPLPCRPVVVVAACLAAGCVAARGLSAVELFRPGSTAVGFWWLVAGMMLGLWCSSVRAGGEWVLFRGAVRFRELVLCAAVCAVGAAWGTVRFDLFPASDLAWQLSETPTPVAIRGTVVESPRLLPPAGDPRRAAAIGPSSECLVMVRAVRDGGRWRPATGRAAVIIDGDPPDLVVGNHVRVLGRGLRPAAPLNPGEFDFRARGRALRCLSIVRCHGADCIRIVARPPAWSPVAMLDRLRTWGAGVLRAHLSAARAPIADALLLGSRQSLPREDAEEFLVTGTVHILSISGLHVGLLAMGLFRLLGFLLVPRRATLVIVVVVLGCYMLLVRAETPVVRATLVVWLACLAMAVHRRAPAFNTLAAAAIVVLAIRPADVFSAGPQLSFLSTAVLIGVSAAWHRRQVAFDPIERLIERSRSPLERLWHGGVNQLSFAFVTGAAVWFVTAPLVAARFHVVSPVGLVLNLLVAPLVALAMGWGVLCLLAAAVSPLVAGACGAVCDLLLAAVAAMVSYAATIPGGHVWVVAPPAWWVGGWYLLGAGAVLVVPAASLVRVRTWATVAACWVAVGLASAALGWLGAPGPGPLRVVVAAMGHGCGIVVRTPAGRCLVYDAGRLGAPGAARRSLAAVLWSEGVSRIDSLVISHADTDHFNAVPELLTRFGVGELVVSRHFLGAPSEAARDLLMLAAAWRIPVRTVEAGDSFAADPWCRVRVLHPEGLGPPGSASGDSIGLQPVTDNEASIVLSIEAAGRRLLLSGDLEGAALRQFVTRGPDSCDVLVAPHHGTRTSLPADIARETAPEIVLVSGVGGPAWPEVRDAYAAAVAGREPTVLKTGGEGAVAVTMSAAAITLTQFSLGRWRPVPAVDSGITRSPQPPASSAGSRPRSAAVGWPRSPPAAAARRL
jgi:competence protein ComEC